MNRQELKQYERWKEEVRFLRSQNQHLRREVDTYRPAWYRLSQEVSDLREKVEEVTAENQRLKQQVKELTLAAQSKGDASVAAPVIKASVNKRRRKVPGRKEGHPAAGEPPDEHRWSAAPAAAPRDAQGRPSCPHCSSFLLDVEEHERIVEDIIPAKVVVTSYHTQSGLCPCCRKRVESRAPEQPPAANIPHGQLGLNALATGVLLRVTHRLPFRQVSAVLADLPGITVCPGAIARQVQRIAGWLENDYEQLLVSVRAAPHVHADETSWRTDGKNGWLWALTTPTQTLYHIDKSRGGKVISKLLGKAFAGILVSDFYSAYSAMNCKKQKCLVHLLRELAQTAEKSQAFASGVFFRKARRLIKQMLLLKGRWTDIDAKRYATSVRRLKARLNELADAEYDEPNARRLGKRLRKYRTELTAFLCDKDLDGTNNAAERAIRPVVVARKISGGSRSENGADAFATVASLLRTAGQQGQRIIGTIKSLLTAAWSAGNPAVIAQPVAAR